MHLISSSSPQFLSTFVCGGGSCFFRTSQSKLTGRDVGRTARAYLLYGWSLSDLLLDSLEIWFMNFVEGTSYFKVWGTACYHHSHPCKQVQRPPWQSECVCVCVWRSTIYPVGIGEVDQCMFLSSLTHLLTTTTTSVTPDAHTPTHTSRL